MTSLHIRMSLLSLWEDTDVGEFSKVFQSQIRIILILKAIWLSLSYHIKPRVCSTLTISLKQKKWWFSPKCKPSMVPWLPQSLQIPYTWQSHSTCHSFGVHIMKKDILDIPKTCQIPCCLVVFLKSQSYTYFMWQVHESTARNAIPATSRSIECSSQSIPGRSGESSSLNHLNPRMSVIFMGKITQIIHCHVWLPNLWNFRILKWGYCTI